MSIHALYPTQEEILPGGKDPMTLAREAYRKRQQRERPLARMLRLHIRPTELDLEIAAPEPDPDRLYTDLVSDESCPVLPAFPTNSLITIMQAVVRVSGVSYLEIASDRRTTCVIRPRHTYYYLARTRTIYSLPEIGRRTGGKDHTTILSGYHKVRRMLDANGLTVTDDLSHDAAASLILNADWSRRA